MNAELLISLLLLGLCATPSFAYDTRFAQPGATVRITASERAFEGILVGQDPDTVRVVTRKEGERRIAQADVVQFKVHGETTNHSGEWMFLGFMGGVFAGVVMANDFDCEGSFLLVPMTGFLGASAGAFLGGAAPKRKWVEVP